MNRLLLSLWLLGAVLYGANTLLYTNVILGWPTPKQKVDTSGAGKEAVKPKSGEAQNQDGKNLSEARSPAEIAEEQSPQPNSQPEASPPAQVPGAQGANAGSHAITPAPPIPPAPQDQARPGAPAQQPQAQSTPAARPAVGQGAATPPPAQSEAQNVPQAQPQQQAETPPAAQPPQQQAGAPPEAQPQQQEWVRIARTGANVRSGPSSSASQLATLPSGMELRVMSRESGWVQIANADGSQTGWIYEGLLEPAGAPGQPGQQDRQGAAAQGSPQAASPDQPGQDQGERVKVSGSSATMRSSPSESAPMLFAFPTGRELRVVSRQPGWVQVTDPGSKQSGWIAESSLAAIGAEGQQQQAAGAAPQRPSRDAGPQSYDSAEGPPPGARGAWVPWDENMGPPEGVAEPEGRPRGRGHHHHGGFAGILRRAFGGF